MSEFCCIDLSKLSSPHFTTVRWSLEPVTETAGEVMPVQAQTCSRYLCYAIDNQDNNNGKSQTEKSQSKGSNSTSVATVVPLSVPENPVGTGTVPTPVNTSQEKASPSILQEALWDCGLG